MGRLYALTELPHDSPWYLFFVSATTHKPNLFSYRCVPGGLWLKGNAKREEGNRGKIVQYLWLILRILALTLSKLYATTGGFFI